jgi:drug/metabolite transporter (DMT)-like permease
MQNQPGMIGRDWALLVLLSILWGGSFFFAKVIVQEVPPFTLVFIRFASAAGALWVYLAVNRTALPRAMSTWIAFAAMGALNNLIPVALIAWAQITIASGLASVLIATTPVFSILVAHCITADERMSANKLVGVALGIAGVVALVGLNTSEGSPGSIVAMLGCLAAALSYGCANVFGRRFKRLGITPTVGAFGQLAATAVMVAPVALVFDRPWRLPPPTVAVLASMLGLVLLSTALAYAIFFRLLASAGTTNVSLVTLLIPVSAILLGTFFLGERLSAFQFAGMALIGLGLVAIDGRVWAAIRPATVHKTTL